VSGKPLAAKRARWRRGGPRALAVFGVLAVVVARLLLRKVRTRADTVAPPSGPPGGLQATAGAESAPARPADGPSSSDAAADGTSAPTATSHTATRVMAGLIVLLACAAVVIALEVPATSHANSPASSRRSGDARHAVDPPQPETVASIVPARASTGVPSDTTVAVTFSQPLAPGSPEPSLSPAVAGSWGTVGSTEMVFTPAAPFVPATAYTVTVPGGTSGVRARRGSGLSASVSSTFTIAPGSVLRLQQLLATLGYLPLEFSGSAPPPAQMAVPQPGVFLWHDEGFPAQYTSLWSPTQFTALTRGAVMAFETQNGLNDDGVAGPAVWTALLADVAAGKRDAAPLTYVLVTKSLPEHLTVWVNGVLTFRDVPCNTGVPGATTGDGTFQVFSHVQVSNMRGTDITGTSYDVTVPWASYFDGGEALHGYPRASYGFPQSNGCVEMAITTAGRVWPSTPIGTLVTVAGPTG
jgi:peptidoglycan hydrolase-like protein with peptidoglycan-binding domain